MTDNINKQRRCSMVMSFLVIIGMALLAALILPAVFFARTENPHSISTSLNTDCLQVDALVFSGQPPDVKVAVASVPEPNLAMGINVLAEVPAFDWCYGCSPTAAAMLFGYYDRTAYPDMYTGPTNGGVVPMSNSMLGWGSGECPLSATHQYLDGLVTRGHVDDYWIEYNNNAKDPFIDGGWKEHTYADCTGDFMGSNQSSLGNMDGGTWFYFDDSGARLYDYTGSEPDFRDGCHGMRLFAESRGYTVVSNYSQYIKGGPGSDPDLGFTFDDFRAEIDAGRPVLIHTEAHTVLGYGYDTTGSIVYLHDTFDHDDHEMTWGGNYLGAQHKAVTVIELEEVSLPTVTITASDVAINDGTTGVDALTITATFSDVMDDGYIPTLAFDPALTSTLTNPSGAWSAGDTVYTWTFDIEDAGVKVDDVDVTVDGGRDLAGYAQVPGTNTDYIDVDTQNPTVTIIASDVSINDNNVGVDALTIAVTFSEVMDNGYIPTLAFDPALTSTLTNPSSVWSAGDTIYTWTFDIEDTGIHMNNVDVTLDGGRDLAGNTQVPRTNIDYIDIDTANPTVTIVASDVFINDSDAGVNAITITATFSEVMDNGYIPTLVFDPSLTSTLTNPSSAWSADDTVYTWTFDIEDAGVQVEDVDVTVDGGRDLASNAQVPQTNIDFLDVDTQNPTVVVIASDVSINKSDVGIDAITITATFSETMDSSHVPTLAFDPLLTSTLTNPSGVWSGVDTVYTWTFDIEDARINVDDIDVTVDGGRDLAGNAQIPGTNTDYIYITTQNLTASIVASDVSINDSDVGVNVFTITATFSETMNNSYTPTVVFNPLLTSTLTNPSGVWSNDDTIYIWTFDIEDAGVNVADVDVTVDGGKALAGDAQVPRTNTDYINVDTHNPTVTITDIADFVNTLASITGTASDTSPGDVAKAELVIEDTIDNKYWDGGLWISNEIWLDTTGTISWSYDTSPIVFANSKSYAVKARSTDKAGNTSTLDSDSFTFYETPVAGFQATPVTGRAPLTVKFTDESMGNIDTYNWDFGDGQTSEEQNPSYTYASQGTYTVVLTISGPGGIDTEIKSDIIAVEERSAPGGCTCPLTDDTTPISELLVGWGMICLCLVIGYYLVRRARRPG